MRPVQSWTHQPPAANAIEPAQINGLLLGHSGLSLEQIEAGGRILAEVLQEMTASIGEHGN